MFRVKIYTKLRSFLNAVPTAELEPITESYVQADEVRIFPESHLSQRSHFNRLTWA